MTTQALAAAAAAISSSSSDAFQRYYEEAGPDYAAWSPHFNMHFGYFRWGMNPLRREAMLEQMNREVADRLQLGTNSPRILDMGCGLGTTLRSLARGFPSAHLDGITLVPWQLERGRILNQSNDDFRRIVLSLGDYEHTSYPSGSFDAVYAIESSCYSNGASKSGFLKEARRLLRPGGRIVVADGFLGAGKLRGPQKAIYRMLCDCWALETMAHLEPFLEELERQGFRDIVAERIQDRVAVSVLHVPWVTLKFLLGVVFFGRRRMTRARLNNVLAPLLMPFVGFPLGPMAYYLVSATRS